MNDWMQTEIETGFQQLICLGLERQPAMDLMGGTVMAWVTALSHNRVWDQGLDAPRFRAAFLTMMGTRTSWPAPKDILEAMPPRPEMKALPAKAPDPEKARRMIEQLAREMKL